VSVNIDPEALDGEVPRMILQPIVENALKHGIASWNGGDTVQITAGCKGERLWMRVRDNGAGLQVRTLRALRTGVGLCPADERQISAAATHDHSRRRRRQIFVRRLGFRAKAPGRRNSPRRFRAEC